MRSGPDVVDLRFAGVGVRVNSVRGRETLAVDIPVWDVKLEVQSSRVVPGRLTLKAPLEFLPESAVSPLNNYGQRLQVFSIIEDSSGVRWECDLGFWLITSWDEDEDAVSVTALDLMQTLEEDPFAWGSSPASGARVSTELQRLAGGLPVVLDAGTFDAPVSPLSQWGTSRTEAIRDLCTAKGLEYAVKADGCLHVWEKRDGRKPVAAYAGDDLLVGFSRESTPRRANRWIVTGTGDGDAKLSATATNVVYPFEPENYGWVTDHREFSAATSPGALGKAAKTYMGEALNPVRTRSFEIICDPRLEVGDVISVHTSDSDVTVGRVVALSIPLSEVGSRMRVDVEELQW